MTGISKIGISIPNHYVDCAELANYRNISKEKVVNEMGCGGFSVPFNESLEDLAKESIRRVGYEEVERFYFCSDFFSNSAIPIPPKILLKLEKKNAELRNIKPTIGKAECLQDVWEYVSLTENPSIITYVDKSTYEEGSLEEFTQGCTTVSIKVSKDGELFKLSEKKPAAYIGDLDDFRVSSLQPPYLKTSDKFSKILYLHTMKNAYQKWKRKNKIEFDPISHFDYFVFYTPYPKMAKHAFAMLYRREKTDLKHPEVEKFFEDPERFDQDRISRKLVISLDGFKEIYGRKVKPPLKYQSEIGNSFTSSIYVSLASAFEEAKAGNNIVIGTYGPRAQAKAFSGTVGIDNYNTYLKKQLKDRKKLSIREYEEWRNRSK